MGRVVIEADQWRISSMGLLDKLHGIAGRISPSNAGDKLTPSFDQVAVPKRYLRPRCQARTYLAWIGIFNIFYVLGRFAISPVEAFVLARLEAFVRVFVSALPKSVAHQAAVVNVAAALVHRQSDVLRCISWLRIAFGSIPTGPRALRAFAWGSRRMRWQRRRARRLRWWRRARRRRRR